MIRIRKNKKAPKELQSKGYQDDKVKKTILEDQDDKCYICERKLTTNYQVEHLASQKNNEDKINDWNNLYIACNYCNNKKKRSFDDIRHPDIYNVENVITHQFNPMQEKVEFMTTSKDNDILQTVRLLERMFNGTNAPIRNLVETRFYNEFKNKYNHFQSVVHDYLSGKVTEMRPIIEKMIRQEEEYLAFKYTVIMQNDTLRNDFADMVKWNKQ